MWGEDWPFSGIQTFAHLPHHKCLLDMEKKFDIGVIGVPFDTAVSYRPGARFGPQAIRKASQRQTSMRGFNFRADINPYQDWASVVDCGDVPVTPMDNSLALKMMTAAYNNLLSHNSKSDKSSLPPRFVTLGGDHSIILPALRALRKTYGRLAVIHFDSHLDTWAPSKYPNFWHSDASEFTHGSMLWIAHNEGLLTENNNVHAGLRTRLSGTDFNDYEDDETVGFHRIEADEIMEGGIQSIVEKIKSVIPSDVPVYISVDIDVLDPSAAPGTGTTEVGGWLTREMIRIIRELEDLNIVGADIVEVSPPYDPTEITALAGAQIAYELITNMVKKGPTDPEIVRRNLELSENLDENLKSFGLSDNSKVLLDTKHKEQVVLHP
ncbi:unnamed protein product [Kluyveromyces dobzhanskii CBS 2104]|uniref:WGS project CCBQ000000000 data, contig 00058 n=1 Tax=Kluyveromyces dobzhanskii CBS 2104 TaxID=1427455 RepID=A0A0A8LDT4_9SACH|nr:unnamed protein product [Kluyveromyces dobzhanskii CBS 2104]